MPVTFPFIPQNITVHLGAPGSSVENVTVSFTEYVKNVASSEIYPTWGDSALRANILAIVSFAVNRVYTGFYRSRGYDFDITSSTAYDQKFIRGRNIFNNVGRIADELFDDYIRRIGNFEPLAAKFCNGTTVTCNGLSQWGSQSLSERGYAYFDILQYYYGNDIEIVADAPIRSNAQSYPGYPIRRGDTGIYVTRIQVILNRISQNYPAIPKVYPVDGIFGFKTEDSVIAFQRIFGLTPDGIVGKATWYELQRLYIGVKRLAELNSEGLRYDEFSWQYPDAIELGDSGVKVNHLQYMLAVIAEFYDEVPSLAVTGYFEEDTKNSVEAFQRLANTRVNGIVGAETWDLIYSYFIGIESEIFNDASLFPFKAGLTNAENSAELSRQLDILNAFSGVERPASPRENIRKDISRFQAQNALPSTGYADMQTRSVLRNAADDMRFSQTNRMLQHSGQDLQMGDRDFSEVNNG